MLSREKENASMLSICLDLKASIIVEVQWNSIQWGTLFHSFKILMETEVIDETSHSLPWLYGSSNQWCRSMHAKITNRLALYLVHKLEVPIGAWPGTPCLSNQYKIVFYTEEKFILAELGQMGQYPRKDLDAYMKRFHEKSLDHCDPVAEYVLIVVCLHGIIEISIVLGEFVFLFFFKVDGGRDTNKWIGKKYLKI